MSLDELLLSDLDTLFDADEFAVEATIGGATVRGILDDEYIEDADIAGTRPVLVCKTADVAAVDQGDTVTIDGTDYEVVIPQPDGTGVTRLVLEVTD